MANIPIKLRTGSACRVVRLERDRFNEAVAAKLLPCVPETSAGRSRVFDPDDMIALWYYRELLEDGFTREAAGRIACSIAVCAKVNPDAEVIAFVEDYYSPGRGEAYRAEDVPNPEDWNTTLLSGRDIRKVTSFRVGKTRKLIAHYTAEELSEQGSDD